jgi:hypothetical protein
MFCLNDRGALGDHGKVPSHAFLRADELFFGGSVFPV